MKCVICPEALEGSQRLFCSNTCKQKAKYATAKGEMCGACYKPMKPMPVMGGFKKLCDRKRCVEKRGN